MEEEKWYSEIRKLKEASKESYEKNVKGNFDWCRIIYASDEANSIRSKMQLDNIVYYSKLRFNWFQRLMFKICFGIRVVNL